MTAEEIERKYNVEIPLLIVKVSTLADYLLPLLNVMVEAKIVKGGALDKVQKFREVCTDLRNLTFEGDNVQDEYIELMDFIYQEFDNVYGNLDFNGDE